jgi:predicted DNA-binding transcriptional regulator AlpA
MSEQPDIQYLTPDDLSAMLQIAVGTISNWRARKIGPEFIRIGGVVRYHPEAVSAWIAAQPTQ